MSRKCKAYAGSLSWKNSHLWTGTNYWILSATLDATVAFSEDEEIGVGKGLVSTETGLRLSYDLIDRAFSPYVGVVHERKYGDTADLAKAEGGGTEDWFAVIGARIAF